MKIDTDDLAEILAELDRETGFKQSYQELADFIIKRLPNTED